MPKLKQPPAASGEEIKLSYEKLHLLQPQLCPSSHFERWLKLKVSPEYRALLRQTIEHLQQGEFHAAIVVALHPALLVAVYAAELDCVVMLQFPSWLIEAYQLAPGKRLLAVNTYKYGHSVVFDLHPGALAQGRYSNVDPYIADFLSDSRSEIDRQKLQIAPAEWERAWNMAKEYRQKYPNLVRDGRPLLSARPAQIQ